MPCYIDPNNETKEEFLSREGQEVISDYISKNYIFGLHCALNNKKI